MNMTKGYPMIERFDPWTCGTVWEPMSPEQYERRIQWYKDYIITNETAGGMSRRTQEYVDYLKRWFSDGPCDGRPNFATRYEYHELPMAFNIYFG